MHADESPSPTTPTKKKSFRSVPVVKEVVPIPPEQVLAPTPRSPELERKDNGYSSYTVREINRRIQLFFSPFRFFPFKIHLRTILLLKCSITLRHGIRKYMLENIWYFM